MKGMTKEQKYEKAMRRNNLKKKMKHLKWVEKIRKQREKN
jgi:hypothetical protein